MGAWYVLVWTAVAHGQKKVVIIMQFSYSGIYTYTSNPLWLRKPQLSCVKYFMLTKQILFSKLNAKL